MREAVSDIHSLKNRAKQTEVAFGVKMDQAAYTYGNAFHEEEKMMCSVDGLHPAIHPLLSKSLETQP